MLWTKEAIIVRSEAIQRQSEFHFLTSPLRASFCNRRERINEGECCKTHTRTHSRTHTFTCLLQSPPAR